MENKPVIDTETGEMLCDGHCGGVCNPQTCDCAENNECDTEPMSTIEQDVEDAVANQRTRQDAVWGSRYHSAHEDFSWIRQALEDTAKNDKNTTDCMKSIWENVKSGDGYSVGVMAMDLSRQAKETAEYYIRLAVAAEKTADSIRGV